MRLVLRHAWLNLWDKHMATGRINQITCESLDRKSSTEGMRRRGTPITPSRVEFLKSPHSSKRFSAPPALRPAANRQTFPLRAFTFSQCERNISARSQKTIKKFQTDCVQVVSPWVGNISRCQATGPAVCSSKTRALRLWHFHIITSWSSPGSMEIGGLAPGPPGYQNRCSGSDVLCSHFRKFSRLILAKSRTSFQKIFTSVRNRRNFYKSRKFLKIFTSVREFPNLKRFHNFNVFSGPWPHAWP